MNNELVEYIRKNVNGQRQRVGVLYATVEPNTTDILIGWSKVNTKAKDVFSPVVALNIAKQRSYAKNVYTLPQMPSSIKKDVKQFEKRCLRYFKGCNIINRYFYSLKQIDKALDAFNG